MFRRKDQWNLCHPVNIYVYRNGDTGVRPTLVHIPADMKRNMESVLQAIQNRLKIDAGYAERLYYTNGLPVCRSSELMMYEEYVVVTSTNNRFRCAEYGRPRSPLISFGAYSKHVRNICVNDNAYNIYTINRRKKEDKKSKFGFIYRFDQDGLGPSELPYLNNSNRTCGSLCQKIQRCSDCQPPCSVPPPEQPPCTAADPNCPCIECPDDNLYNDDAFYDGYKKQCDQVVQVPKQFGNDCKPAQNHMCVSTTDLQCTLGEFPNSDADSEHLLAFINRYRDIGGKLYRMFHERLNEDCKDVEPSQNCGKEDDHSWYADHLFGKFLNKIEDEESGMPSSTNYTRSSGKSLEFDKMSDTRTGVKPVSVNSNPSQNTDYQDPPPSNPRTSLSDLIKSNDVISSTGTTNPRNNEYTNQNNAQLYHAQIKLDRPEINYYANKRNNNKDEDDLLKDCSKYSFQKLRDRRDQFNQYGKLVGHLSEQSSGNNNSVVHGGTNDAEWSYTQSPLDDIDYISDDDLSNIPMFKGQMPKNRRHSQQQQRQQQQRLLPDEEPYEIVDNFQRHQHELNFSPRRNRNVYNEQQRSRNDGRPSHGRINSNNIQRQSDRSYQHHNYIPSNNIQQHSFELNDDDDENFQILHHHQIHARPERQRLPQQRIPTEYQNARLLIPTYDTNGNFSHYVFQ